MSRQRSQVSTLKFQARSNGLRAPSHRPLLIGETVLFEISIDGFQVSAFWQGDEVIAASIADQILDASFLPTGMHIGKKGLEAIDTVKVQKHVLFSAVMPFQDLQNGRFEIRFAKVKLCSLPRRKVERDVGRFRTLSQFLDEQTHSGFPNRNAKLAQL